MGLAKNGCNDCASGFIAVGTAARAIEDGRSSTALFSEKVEDDDAGRFSLGKPRWGSEGVRRSW